jgi:hypothetical protein
MAITPAWKTPRACACGCGKIFQPVRRNHAYADGHRHRMGAVVRLTQAEVEALRSVLRKIDA